MAANARALLALEEAATDLLTLSEGLAWDELERARLTLRAIKERLATAAAATSQLSSALRDAMPELDLGAWQACAARVGQREANATDALKEVIEVLAPTTLGWLRIYRRQRPELF